MSTDNRDLAVETVPAPPAAVTDSGEQPAGHVVPFVASRYDRTLNRWYRSELRAQANEMFLMLADMRVRAWKPSGRYELTGTIPGEWYAAAYGALSARAEMLAAAAANMLNDLDGVYDVEGPA